MAPYFVMSEYLLFLAFLAFSYFLAALSSAIIVSKLFKLPSPIEHGSKNPGATNVLRLAGKKYAAIVLVFDILKGVLPVALAKYAGLSLTMAASCGLFAVIGHMFPIYYRFHGGKGIATAIGCYFSLHPLLGLISLGLWFITYRICFYSSASSVAMVIFTPLAALLMYPNEHITLSLVLIAILAIIKHKSNLIRLKKGQEPKTYFRQKK